MAAEDWIPDFMHYPSYDLDMPCTEDYFNLSDQELFDQTSAARNQKIKSIRKYFKSKGFISEKQRYCLADWIAENESKYV